jgi:uncharacterized membrane protein YkoI
MNMFKKLLSTVLLLVVVPVISLAGSYSKDLPQKLMANAKVSEAEAAVTALSKVSGGEIKAVEIESEGGKLIYSYEIRVKGRAGIEEVNIDAITGKLIGVEHENAATEKKEAAQEK